MNPTTAKDQNHLRRNIALLLVSGSIAVIGYTQSKDKFHSAFESLTDAIENTGKSVAAQLQKLKPYDLCEYNGDTYVIFEDGKRVYAYTNKDTVNQGEGWLHPITRGLHENPLDTSNNPYGSYIVEATKEVNARKKEHPINRILHPGDVVLVPTEVNDPSLAGRILESYNAR